MQMLTKSSQNDYRMLSAYGYRICSRLHHIAPEIDGIYMIYHGDDEWLLSYQPGDEDYEFLVIDSDPNVLIQEAMTHYCTVAGGCDDLDDDYLMDDGA